MRQLRSTLYSAAMTLSLAGCAGPGDAVRAAPATDQRVDEQLGSAISPVAEAAAADPERATSEVDNRIASEAEARGFVDSLFNRYAANDPIDYFEEPARVFEPQLAAAFEALMVSWANSSSTDIPDLGGGDWICGCQDWGDFSHTINSLTITGDRAAAQVSLVNFGETTQRTIELKNTTAGWRIYDLDGEFRARAFSDLIASDQPL